MQRLSYPFFFVILTGLTLFSCKKDDEAEPVQALTAQTVKNIAADAETPRTNRFTLYSLKNNAIVPNADSATNKWDIGFRATTIIVNGGSIRVGSGGAWVYTGLFDELKEVPQDATFRTDTTPTELAIPTGSGNGWYNYNQTTNIISPIPGRVLVIKTGEGKYAKVEIISYYKDAPATPAATDATRYYTFRYSYQADGSKKLN